MTPLPDNLERDPDGFIAFRGHRLRLIDVAARFDEGHSAEGIVVDFYPTLSLASVYKAIAFYLEHEEEVKAEIARNAAALRDLESRPPSTPSLAELRERMRKKRAS